MFSSAPRCQRIRWRQSALTVGITSVMTRHCMGGDHPRPQRLQGERHLVVLGHRQRVIDTAGLAGDERAARVGDRFQGVCAEQRRGAREHEDLPETARPRTWREALERIAFAYRGFLDAHPNVLPLLVGRLPVGPQALTIRERSLAALTEHGFSQALAARAFTTLLQYVVGSAVTQAGSPAPDEAAAIRDYYRSLGAVHPHVAAAAEALTHTPREAGFVEGLDIVLDGIDRTHRRSPR